MHVHALRCKSFGAGSVKGLIRIEAATVETRLTETESFTGALGSFDQDKQRRKRPCRSDGAGSSAGIFETDECDVHRVNSKVQKQIGLCKPRVPLPTEGIIDRIRESENQTKNEREEHHHEQL